MNKTYQLILSRFFGSAASKTFMFYLFYYTFQQTKSTFLTGGIGLILFFPYALLNLKVGKYCDRIEAIGKTYTYSVLIKLICFAFILIFPQYYLFLIILFLFSLLKTIRTPLYYRLLKRNSKNDSLFIKLNTLSWQIPMVLGPLAITSLLPFGQNFILLFLCSLQLFAFIFSLSTFKMKTISQVQKKISLMSSFKINNQLLLPMITDSLLNCFFGLNVVLISLLSHIHADASKYGLYKSLFHFASLIFILLIPKNMYKNDKGRRFQFFLLLWIFTMSLFYFSTSIYLLALCIGILGSLDGFSSILRENYLMKYSASHNIGSLSAVSGTLIAFGDEFGEFCSGFIIEGFGITFLISINILISVIFLVLSQHLRSKKVNTSLKLLV